MAVLRSTARRAMRNLHGHPSLVAANAHQHIPSRSFQLSHRKTDYLSSALQSNQQWAESTASSDDSFFTKCAQGQAPKILWLGCSDSRVPETTVLGLKPGDVFTHRNIANIINPTDINILAVVEYAVAHLKVQHVVVCGHTSCGGVAATLANGSLGVIDTWLQPMRAIREKHAQELAKLEGAEKATFMSEANIKGGVEVLKRMPTIIKAVKERGLTVHGIIYELHTGKLREVACDEPLEVEKDRVAAFELK